MLVLVDQDRAATTDESPGVGANRRSGGGIVAVDDGASEKLRKGTEKGALTDGAWTVQNKCRLLGQAASQHGRQLARSDAGKRSVHDPRQSSSASADQKFRILRGPGFASATRNFRVRDLLSRRMAARFTVAVAELLGA